MHSVNLRTTKERPQDSSYPEKNAGPSKFKVTHQVHINTIGVGPDMVEAFHKAKSQWIRDAVKMNELPDFCHLTVVSGLRRVQLSDNCTHIAKYTGIH